MLTFLLAAMAIQGSADPTAAKPSPPPIVVEGKSDLVCTSVRITGSRVGRQRVCRSRQQAAIEAEQSRQAALEGAAIQAVGQAIACGPPSIQSCN